MHIGQLQPLTLGDTTTTETLAVTHHAFNPKTQHARNKSTFGQANTELPAEIIKQYSLPRIEGYFDVRSAFWMLRSLLGEPTLDGNRKTFTVSDTPPLLRLTTNEHWVDAMLDNLTLRVSTQNYTTYETELKGLFTQHTTTPPVIDLPAQYPFKGSRTTVTVSDGAAAQTLDVTSLSVSFLRDVYMRFAIGSVQPQGFCPRQLDIMGILSLQADSSLLRAGFESGIPLEMNIEMSADDGCELQMMLPEIIIQEYNNDPHTHLFAFSAEYNSCYGASLISYLQ